MSVLFILLCFSMFINNSDFKTRKNKFHENKESDLIYNDMKPVSTGSHMILILKPTNQISNLVVHSNCTV